MLQLVLLVGKIVFLLVLYAFVFFVVRSINRDLRTAPLISQGVGGVPDGSREARKALRRAAAAGDLVVDDPLSHAWELVVRTAPRMAGGAVFPMAMGTDVLVGRALDCDVQLHDTFVSSHHARLRVTAEGLTIQDLESTNGTFVNGSAVEGPLILAVGDEIAIGDAVFVVGAG
jgi:hypothetical protein